MLMKSTQMKKNLRWTSQLHVKVKKRTFQTSEKISQNALEHLETVKDSRSKLLGKRYWEPQNVCSILMSMS